MMLIEEDMTRLIALDDIEVKALDGLASVWFPCVKLIKIPGSA